MKRKIAIVLSVVALWSCKKDEPVEGSNSVFEKGVFISNEGAFGSGLSTLAHYGNSDNSTTKNVFFNKNNYNLGDVFQSMTLSGSKAFMIINNSGVVEVANATDFETLGQISGFSSPRYMLEVSTSQGYVSDWVSNSIQVIDLNSQTITGSINVGTGPEQMAISNGKVYVANSGGFDVLPDSTVMVIDVASGQVVDTLFVGYSPQSLQVDVNGNLWVLCRGISDWQTPANNTPGRLVKIDFSGSVPEFTKFNFTSTTQHPAHLKINGDGNILYFVSDIFSGQLFKMSIADVQLPSAAFIPRTFYSIGVSPENQDVYGSNALDFNQEGWVYRYDMNGSILDSFQTGVIPGNFTFVE